VFLSQTIFGRYLPALRGNPQATDSGIPTARMRGLVYLPISGLAGLGGILDTKKIASPLIFVLRRKRKKTGAVGPTA
jgi:ribose/xylose/arabinose/galactoside ABC-type transport system permease subunit